MLEMVASELVNIHWHRGSQAHDTPIPLSPTSKLYISETKRHCQGQAYRKLDSEWAKLAEVTLLCVDTIYVHIYTASYSPIHLQATAFPEPEPLSLLPSKPVDSLLAGSPLGRWLL